MFRQPKFVKRSPPNSLAEENYDIYILQHNLEEFVAEKVLPELEGKYNYKVYFPHRDDTPGKNIFSNIEDAMTKSNAVILFVTNECLKESWFRYLIQLVVCTGVRSLYVALDKSVNLEQLPLPVAWLCELCSTLACFNTGLKEEMYQFGALNNLFQKIKSPDMNTCTKPKGAICGHHGLLTSTLETTKMEYDVCVIDPEPEDNKMFADNLESELDLCVFSSERDVHSRYYFERLLIAMHASQITIFILTSAYKKETMEFLRRIAFSRLTIPCLLFYDPCLLPIASEEIQSDYHRIVPIGTNFKCTLPTSNVLTDFLKMVKFTPLRIN